MSLRSLFLSSAKSVGLFHLFHKLTHNQLRILCYHGASRGDECRFRPSLFISERTFRRRIGLLSELGCNVLSLADGIERLKNGTLPKNAVVITIDDGWYGTADIMAPVLAEYGYPATLYLSTYYVQNQYPVFNVALQYVVWKRGTQMLDLVEVDCCLEGAHDMSNLGEANFALRKIQTFADSLEGANKRHALLKRVGSLLGVDVSQIEASRNLSFMNSDEVVGLRKFGVDVQLHTHRHRFPSTNIESARKEIVDNRGYLEKLSINNRQHFCYPSGEYVQRQISWLRELAIVSATTTDLGLNSSQDSVFELKRILDADNSSEVQFEAELCGMSSVMRKFLSKS